MFARIGTWQGSSEELERWIRRSREEVKPSIRQDQGLSAAYWLVDRDAGKGLIVTLWESADAMRASEEARLKRQAATTATTGAKVTTERFEIVDSLMMGAEGGGPGPPGHGEGQLHQGSQNPHAHGNIVETSSAPCIDGALDER
jgi:heme-degrading monooxygenase HmoA